MSGDQSAFPAEWNVSRETFERLGEYEALIRKWNPAINLVSKATLNDIWTRHFLDSAQVYRAAPQSARNWVDVGAGGGFPGLVAAIFAKDENPEMAMTLVESDQRKSAFLMTVARELDLNAKVIAHRIEDIPHLNADVFSARALASLDKLLEFSEHHLAKDGVAIFPKGAQWKSELKAARIAWTFSSDTVPSLTEPDAVILKITGASRV